ncbi:hypothetical protein Taro_032308 [Colocasia esculenta]|uniref:Uncharacterized protein n=1 Tax=Colocasia esculenta TaxID=4460 RepID=A0A843W1K0_COLES|nr:hypothetical protein [Colocasia esculenta]
MPITDPSHTFHSASSSGHHVTEEHVIEKDEKDEIDSQDDIDDNENMDEGDDEPLFDIAMIILYYTHRRGIDHSWFTLARKQKFLNVGSIIGAWVVGQLTPAL